MSHHSGLHIPLDERINNKYSDHTQWINICRKTLLDMETRNIHCRAKHWTELVNEKVKDTNSRLNLDSEKFNNITNKFVYKVDNASMQKHLEFIINWCGLKTRDIQHVPKSYLEYENKGKNWLNGRRASTYGATLFPEMIKASEIYADYISRQIFANNAQHSTLYGQICIIGFLSSLCSARISLNHTSKKAYLICENSVKTCRTAVSQILQRYANDHPYQDKFPTHLREASDFFENKYMELISDFSVQLTPHKKQEKLNYDEKTDETVYTTDVCDMFSQELNGSVNTNEIQKEENCKDINILDPNLGATHPTLVPWVQAMRQAGYTNEQIQMYFRQQMQQQIAGQQSSQNQSYRYHQMHQQNVSANQQFLIQNQQQKLQMARNIIQAYNGRVTIEQVLNMPFDRVQSLHNEIAQRLNPGTHQPHHGQHQNAANTTGVLNGMIGLSNTNNESQSSNSNPIVYDANDVSSPHQTLNSGLTSATSDSGSSKFQCIDAVNDNETCFNGSADSNDIKEEERTFIDQATNVNTVTFTNQQHKMILHSLDQLISTHNRQQTNVVYLNNRLQELEDQLVKQTAKIEGVELKANANNNNNNNSSNKEKLIQDMTVRQGKKRNNDTTKKRTPTTDNTNHTTMDAICTINTQPEFQLNKLIQQQDVASSHTTNASYVNNNNQGNVSSIGRQPNNDISVGNNDVGNVLNNNAQFRQSIQDREQMVKFIQQLQQFPPLFQHLQNNPHVLTQLLQQFKWKQEENGSNNNMIPNVNTMNNSDLLAELADEKNDEIKIEPLTVIKVVNNNDIRIWRYNHKCNFDDLNIFITSTWNIMYGQYIIQYKDDENDLMTIASDIDLNDALQIAQSQNKKSLKIYVNKGKAVQMDGEAKFRTLVLDFLSNKEMKILLPQLFNSLISKIIGANISDIQYKKYAKYIKCRKIKMPQQSIINKMKFDGFTQNEIDIFIENKFENKQKITKKYTKYMKLIKIKMPKQSIRNRMKFDGFNKEEIDLFFKQIEKAKYKVLKTEQIIEIIYTIINCSPCRQHPLYVKYGNILVPYIAEKVFIQQSVYQHFRFHTLQTWLNKLVNNLYESILQSTFTDFNSIGDDIIENITVEFPLDSDYGEAIHFGTKCEDCKHFPIIGERYKCLICFNINLCMKCEKKHNERHPLMQFKKSSKVTSIVVCNEKREEKEFVTNDMVCICGKRMEYVLAKSAYNWTDIVFCDFCDKKYFNEMVYHCPNGKHIMHKQGYDICIHCVSAKYKKQLKELLV